MTNSRPSEVGQKIVRKNRVWDKANWRGGTRKKGRVGSGKTPWCSVFLLFSSRLFCFSFVFFSSLLFFFCFLLVSSVFLLFSSRLFCFSFVFFSSLLFFFCFLLVSSVFLLLLFLLNLCEEFAWACLRPRTPKALPRYQPRVSLRASQAIEGRICQETHTTTCCSQNDNESLVLVVDKQ